MNEAVFAQMPLIFIFKQTQALTEIKKKWTEFILLFLYAEPI